MMQPQPYRCAGDRFRVDRRTFLSTAAVGVLLGGCQSSVRISDLPSLPWGDAPPEPGNAGQVTGGDAVAAPSTRSRLIRGILPRSAWASKPPIEGRMVKMPEPIRYLTLHHTGSTRLVATDTASVRAYLNRVHEFHTSERMWGDIGYHFAIDPAGRVWQARSLSRQGAHVKHHNEHNIGIVMLGNYDEQRASEIQLRSLASFFKRLATHYRIPSSRIRSHQEWAPTACPGRYLQPRFAALRRAGHLA